MTLCKISEQITDDHYAGPFPGMVILPRRANASRQTENQSQPPHREEKSHEQTGNKNQRKPNWKLLSSEVFEVTF